MGDDDTPFNFTSPSAVAQTRDANYDAVGSIALLVYDTILTLDREVALVWIAKWTPPKVLYFIARYFGVVSQIVNVTQSMKISLSPIFCQRIQYFSGASYQLLVGVVQIILIQRVRSFYLHNTFLRFFLAFVLVGSIVAQCVMLVFSLKEITATVNQAGMGGCQTTYVADLYDAYWRPPLIVEGILCILVVARVVGVVRRGWNADALYVLWMHDGIVFFAFIFAGLLTCWSILHFVEGPLQEVGIPWLIAIFSISGARLHLNQQEARATLLAEQRKSSGPKALRQLGANGLPFHTRPVSTAGTGANSVSFGIVSRPPTGHVLVDRPYEAGGVYAGRQDRLHSFLSDFDTECSVEDESHLGA